jgi:uncharacterized repeat protein (TIGR01451 family)
MTPTQPGRVGCTPTGREVTVGCRATLGPSIRWMPGLGGLCVLATLAMLLVMGAPALAATPSPGWSVSPVPQPTNFSSSRNAECKAAIELRGVLEGIPSRQCDRYLVTVRNEGSEPTDGSTVTITDTLPEGFTAVSISSGEGEGGPAPTLTCELATVACSYNEVVPPGGALVMVVDVEVPPSAPREVSNSAAVSGGGAPSISTSARTTVSSVPPTFGPTSLEFQALGVDGALDLQAGDHPDAVTTSFQFATVKFAASEGATVTYLPVQDVKDVAVELPPGFIGDPQATPRCPEYLLLNSACPSSSRVGTIGIEAEGGGSPGVETQPVFNIAPEHGHPAEFGFEYLSREFVMYADVVRSASGYGLRVSVPGLPRLNHTLEITGVTLTFFGNPAAQDGGATMSAAFFTNPVDCSAPGPLTAKLEADSWQNPGQYVSKEAMSYPRMTGCNILQFEPTITVQPETTQADEPAGYNVNLEVPQTTKLFPALATPELQNTVVTLPEGVSVSPSAADGLVGCPETGPEGIDIAQGERHPNEVGEGEALGADGLSHLTAGHCPAGSTLGTVEITTFLLASPLNGHVYLAQPKCGGEGQPACTEASATNGELFGLYIEAEGSGVVIKLPGTVAADPATGRLTATFKNNPQLPFSDLRLQFTGGPRAPLANPQGCGSFTTTSDLSPWSAPETPDATPSSSFAVTGCSGPMPFAPSFSAGTVTPTAGAFSVFTLTFSRHDGEQDLSGVTVQTPVGLLGMLSQVQLCPEPQASQSACGPQSLIGHTQVAAGAGSHPFWVGGSVFLTGPYRGAPFGLSIVTHAQAGPFDLGDVIVRAAIHVDPHTSALTVVSDRLPQIIDGVPLRIQTVNVAIDKPGFMFNPTNCSPLAITGTITAAQGASANLASPFAAAGCKNLPFKPKFTVLTQAKTSKANGASLHVKVVSGPGQANIGQVKVDLPKQLPSRLTTLQKACLAAVFDANPAACPAGSVVGTGWAVTPVLKNILTGPAYLVSHGGAAFPDLVIVLQGEGITLDLVGNTDIKKGITSSTFKAVPDAPVSTFDLVLPEGPHSALTANGSLCGSETVTVRKSVAVRVHGRLLHVLKNVKQVRLRSLNMPTAITGQNGAVVKQTTKIAVSGCPKHKKAKKKVKKAIKKHTQTH